jgi:hypothetical protein
MDEVLVVLVLTVLVLVLDVLVVRIMEVERYQSVGLLYEYHRKTSVGILVVSADENSTGSVLSTSFPFPLPSSFLLEEERKLTWKISVHRDRPEQESYLNLKLNNFPPYYQLSPTNEKPRPGVEV